MRLLFDAFWWAEGQVSNQAVQRDIISAWRRRFPGDELVLAVRRGVRIDDAPESTTITTVAPHLWPHAAVNRLELPRVARRVNADAVVAHNYTPASGRSAVFIHDAIFAEHPEWFSVPERIYYRPMLPWAEHATVVATSTETEGRRIRRYSRGRVEPRALGLGVPTRLTSARPLRPAALNGVESFSVTVGRLNIRKNLELILKGACASRSTTPEHPLVVVGDTKHSGKSTDLAEHTLEAVRDKRVILAGNMSDAELSWLYRHADLAITLSLDEGFGLPAIEAAQFGVRLLASDIPVFRETVGEYAEFVSPTADPSAVADAIDRAMRTTPSPEAVAAMRSRYTWTATVEALRGHLCETPRQVTAR